MTTTGISEWYWCDWCGTKVHDYATSEPHQILVIESPPEDRKVHECPGLDEV